MAEALFFNEDVVGSKTGVLELREAGLDDEDVQAVALTLGSAPGLAGSDTTALTATALCFLLASFLRKKPSYHVDSIVC